MDKDPLDLINHLQMVSTLVCAVHHRLGHWCLVLCASFFPDAATITIGGSHSDKSLSRVQEFGDGVPVAAAGAVVFCDGWVSVDEDGVDEADVCLVKGGGWGLDFSGIDVVPVARPESLGARHDPDGLIWQVAVESFAQVLQHQAHLVDCGAPGNLIRAHPQLVRLVGQQGARVAPPALPDVLGPKVGVIDADNVHDLFDFSNKHPFSAKENH